MEKLVFVPAFLLALGIIVFMHEFGHHVVARLFGVRVMTFSLGFGKRLWGFPYKGTDYRISAIPLGGYVRMGGELPGEHTGDPAEFLSKPRWQRILVYLAGPAMNLVLSVTLIAAVLMVGYPVEGLMGLPPVVGRVNEGSAADVAGLQPGDRIAAVDGEQVAKWDDFSFAVLFAPNKPLEVEYVRDGEARRTRLTPGETRREKLGDAGIWPNLELRIAKVLEGRPAERAGFQPGDVPRRLAGQPVSVENKFVEFLEQHAGEEVLVEVERRGKIVALSVVPEADETGAGKIGVHVAVYRRLSLREAVPASIRYNIFIVEKTVEVLGKLVTGETSMRSSTSGPIEIARFSGEAAQRGLKDWVFIVGFLSISIGLMNLLPIPILDGGHIVILTIESVMRRDLSLVVKERITQVGFMMLMVLMAVVLFFDLAKNGILPS